MSEFAPRGIPDIERRPELDPSRRVEILPDEKIEVVDIFTSPHKHKDDAYYTRGRIFDTNEARKALAHAKSHARKQRAIGDPRYIGTIIQHERFRSVRLD